MLYRKTVTLFFPDQKRCDSSPYSFIDEANSSRQRHEWREEAVDLILNYSNYYMEHAASTVRTVDGVGTNLHISRNVHETVHVLLANIQLSKLGVLGV